MEGYYMKRKILSLLLSFTLCLTLLPMAAFAEEPDKISITTVDELLQFAKAVDNGEYDDKTDAVVSLDADLDLTGVAWKPIGSVFDGDGNLLHYFSGKFYGNGHTISNLDFSENYGMAEYPVFGFFSVAYGAEISGLTIQGKLDVSNSGYVFFGTVAGVAENSKISDCVSDVSFTDTVTDKNGKELKLTDKGNGKYTFTMPASKVEVNATFVKEVEISPFSDVSTSAYYYEAVKWAQEKGITGGIGNGLFGPNQPCTRAQIVTFLWRAAGSPEPKSMSSFSDVSADSYYAKAVAWAVENGITTGTGDGKFSPDATCTREQAVAFLYRASGSPAVSGGSAFSDVAANAYYADAVAWAEKNGVTGGIGGGLFGSGNTCTRAQIVTFLYRAYQGK